MLILIVAILFGLYFLVIEARPAPTGDEGEAAPPADEAVDEEAAQPAEGKPAPGEADTQGENVEEAGGEADTPQQGGASQAGDEAEVPSGQAQ